MQAWAVFSNHLHFVAIAPKDATTLIGFMRDLHSETARGVNQMDGASGRQVWFQYRDTNLTFHKSYLARLHYVIHNPVKHGLVSDARGYPWCSAAWFEKEAIPSFRETVYSMPIDRVKVPDDFDPM